MPVSPFLRHLLWVALWMGIALPFIKYSFMDAVLEDYTGGDFAIYYVAAERMEAGKSPYPLEALSHSAHRPNSPIWGEYPYPPFLARLLTPLTSLDMFVAKHVYIFVCLVAFFALISLLMVRKRWGSVEVFLAGVTLLGWGPLIYSLRLGQSELLAIPFLAAAWCLVHTPDPASPVSELSSSWEMAAGFCLGVAAMVRFTPVLMLPVLILTGRFRLAGSFMMGALATLILSGPWSSWEFFTRVLPSMSDVSRMRDCPAIHVQVLHLLDAWAPSAWAGYFSTIATVASGLVYVVVLALFWAFRRRLTTETIVLLACFLPPLFAGKNTHHYAVAVLPVMSGMVIFGNLVFQRIGLFPSEAGQGEKGREFSSRKAAVFLLFWPVALIPSFYYWYPCKRLVDKLAWNTSISTSSFLVLSNLAAFCLLLVLLIKPGTAQSGHLKEELPGIDSTG